MPIKFGHRLTGMDDAFHGSRVKIERAKKHIADLHNTISAFTNTNFYSMEIEFDGESGTNHLCFTLDLDRFPHDDCAVIIGDAFHDLRSALDLLWQVVILKCAGTPTAWS